MKFKLLDKIAILLYEKILTYPSYKLLMTRKYEVQKRK